jgi:hypothetical protein
MKFKKTLSVFLLLLSLLLAFSFAKANSVPKGYVPKNGFVPDKQTAIKIAEAIWLPIYGKDIYEEKPFIARLSKDKKVWFVRGTLNGGSTFTKDGLVYRTIMLGGVAYIEIEKETGRILKVYHTR